MDLEVLGKSICKFLKDTFIFLYVFFVMLAIVGVIFAILTGVFYCIVYAGSLIGIPVTSVEKGLAVIGFGIMGAAAFWAFVIDPIQVNYKRYKWKKDSE